MRLTQIEDLLRASPREDSAKELAAVITAWMRGRGGSKELIRHVRETLQRTRPPQTQHTWDQVNDAWATFERELSSQVRTMTPYELCRTFGLVEAFDAMTSQERHSLIARLRVDPASPEPQPKLDRFANPKPDVSGMTRQQASQAQQQWEQREQLRQQQQLWEQQFFQPQQDPMISAIQKAARAPRPREMLDPNSREGLRKMALSRGIDLQSKSALKLQADDVEEAIQLACLLSHERGCDLFRGQAVDWKPIPALLRKPGLEAAEGERWERFRQWAQGHEALASIAGNQKKLAAVAQHYGLPTLLLDFSKNPRVAAFFATHTEAPPEAGHGCIYCLTGSALDEVYAPSWMRYYEVAPEVERVEVDGLHRMHAQEGCFVYANQTWWTRFFEMDVIRFPRKEPVATPEAKDIYPAAKSEIERLVDAYFEREQSIA